MDITALNGTKALRIKVLKWMCLTLAGFSFFFSFFNLFVNNLKFLGVLESIFAAYCFFIYVLISKASFKFWQPLSICFCCSFLVVLGSYVAFTNYVPFVWIFTLPLLYYLLLGTRWGFVFSSFLIIFECIALWAKHVVSPFITVNFIFNLTLSFIAIWVVAHAFEKNRESSHKKLEDLALLDPLTGVGNRFAMNHFFDAELMDKTGLFTMILDLDFFKQINDEFGHAVGDKVLAAITSLLKQTLPKGKIFRIGGEEFAIFIPYSSFTKVNTDAHTLRRVIEMNEFIIDGKVIPVTASIGVAKYQAGQTLKQVLKAADEKLYQAKDAGRNRVIFDKNSSKVKLESAC